MNTLKITNMDGARFNVVKRVHHDGKPEVAFYDDGYKGKGFDPILGQFISSYYLETLMEEAETLASRGLDLCEHVARWKVDPDQMAKVIDFIKA